MKILKLPRFTKQARAFWSSISKLIHMQTTKSKNFTLIAGYRDNIETALAHALFGTDQSEIDRLINQLNQISLKQPILKLIKSDDIVKNKSLR